MTTQKVLSDVDMQIFIGYQKQVRVNVTEGKASYNEVEIRRSKYIHTFIYAVYKVIYQPNRKESRGDYSPGRSIFSWQTRNTGIMSNN